MQDKVLKRDIESAGGWFVGEYSNSIIEKYNDLESNKDYKNQFIKDVFNNQGRDSDYGGTRVRVNALLRIVRGNKVLEALNYIIASDRINKDDPNAIEMAKEVLMKLQSK